MKKAYLIVLIFLILIAQGALVNAKQIHKDWHVYNDIFTIDGKAYELVAKPGNTDVILFKTEGFSTILDEGTCDDNGDYRYCYLNYSFEYDKKAAFTESGGVLMPGIQVSIDKDDSDSTLSSVLSVTQTYTTSIMVGKDDKFLVKLKNTGDLFLQSLKYEIEIPEGIEITDLKQFTQVGKKIYINTALTKGAEKEYEFRYKTVKTGVYNFERSYEYDDTLNVKQNSASLKLTIKSPLEFSGKIAPSSADIQEYVILSAKVKNLHDDYSMDIERMLIKGPASSVEYMPSKNVELYRVGEFIGKIDNLDPLEEKDFELKIIPKQTGKQNFTGEITVKINGDEYKSTFNASVTIKAEGIVADFYTNKKDVLAGGETSLIYALGNDNQELNFKNLTVVIKSDFFNDSFTVDSVQANSAKNTVYSKKISVPLIPTDEKFDVIANTTYYTETGEKKNFEKKLTLSVTGAGEILRLTQTVTKPSTINPGDEVTVKVDIENLKDESFQGVRLLEDFSRGGVVSFGDSFITLSLSPQEKKQAYLYKLKIPDQYFLTTFNITSTVVISNLGYTKSKLTTLKINATPLDQMAGNNPSDSKDLTKKTEPKIEKTNSYEDSQEKEPNFMVKMIRSIENFFNSLFG